MHNVSRPNPGRTSTLVMLALCVVLVLIGSSAYAAARGIWTARQTVTTTFPGLGVHTRLTDEVEEWKVNKTFEMARELGAPWAVEYFPWSYMESRQGAVSWDHADMVVRSAYAQGITLIARIDGVPDWARPVGTPSRYLASDHYAEYADFVARFVQRYQGKVNHILVWNEPNTAFEWGYRAPSPEQYTELLRITAARVRQVDPSVKIIAAGLAPTVERTELALDDLVYLQRMYDAGAKGTFDIMSAHAYGWTSPPDEPADPGKVNFARTELLRQVMERNGDAATPVFITEGGWNDHPRWTKAVRPGQRIEYTVRAMQKVQREWPWCQVLAFWAFRLPAPTHTYNDYYTFVNYDFSPKPIYEAIQRITTER